MTNRSPNQASQVAAAAPAASNFIRNIVEADLAQGRYAMRRWAGRPTGTSGLAGAAPDPAKIRTRFPPEPNGYLHLGHAKSILLNFGLAQAYGGVCHMRFDDTNPVKEDQEYVDSILDAVQWLGCSWGPAHPVDCGDHLYYASDYFDFLFEAALALIRHGHAYVDSQSAEEIRATRGTLTEPGRDSPYRNRSVEENVDLFLRMKAGEFPDGALVVRAKIDMRSPNINLRDPAIYRIRHATHHRTGDRWCIYPLYDFTHCVSDALENITHSICTLEFEDHRPLYDWVLQRLAEIGLLTEPLPQQYEFSRLNLTYVVLSKRKLIQLVEDGHVEGWDDPRMPTLVGARRRGYTAEGFRRFAERIGVSKADSWIDYSVLEGAMREHLNESAPRRIAVLDPIKLVLENYPEAVASADAGHTAEGLPDLAATEDCHLPNHPQKPEWGHRTLRLGRELWIERDDFAENPPKGYFRLFPGNRVRLRHGYVVECTGFSRNHAGEITEVKAKVLFDSRSGTPGADLYKVKGNIHWLSVADARPARLRIYDRLFKVAQPGSRRAGDADGQERSESAWLEDLNPASLVEREILVEPALLDASVDQPVQIERHGYCVADRVLHRPGHAVFNYTVGLRDSWSGN